MQTYGKLTTLVNNAGIVALGKIGQFDMDKFRNVIDVNLSEPSSACGPSSSR